MSYFLKILSGCTFDLSVFEPTFNGLIYWISIFISSNFVRLICIIYFKNIFIVKNNTLSFLKVINFIQMCVVIGSTANTKFLLAVLKVYTYKLVGLTALKNTHTHITSFYFRKLWYGGREKKKRLSLLPSPPSLGGWTAWFPTLE